MSIQLKYFEDQSSDNFEDDPPESSDIRDNSRNMSFYFYLVGLDKVQAFLGDSFSLKKVHHEKGPTIRLFTEIIYL